MIVELVNLGSIENFDTYADLYLCISSMQSDALLLLLAVYVFY